MIATREVLDSLTIESSVDLGKLATAVEALLEGGSLLSGTSFGTSFHQDTDTDHGPQGVAPTKDSWHLNGLL